ncbi:hypothetical protein OF829_08650 [Sphingomonas sp. LB-2]|uniref:hypothetical protein n=1 Tax=Sphingomonas caeni TaxID=2984949 RepID=UPI00222F85DD|nr:hypothetical protein [Sphingomonas caeni]MCW3847309.1 hypothetical protein [Sphingomonas caeni]
MSSASPSPWPQLRAVAITALVAAVAGDILFCIATGQFEVTTAFLMLWGFFLIAAAHIALAAPPIARIVIGSQPLTPFNCALTGMLAGVLPTAAFLVIGVAAQTYLGNAVDLREWLFGLVGMAICGIVAGLVFEAVSPARGGRRG